jgi:uncharacterized membrane protein
VTNVLLRRASVALCLAGDGTAGYVTYVHYAGLRPICGISRGCETVQTSRYASRVGIPVALLGLISYMLILITLTMRDARALLTGSGLTLIAFGFSVYLTYREVFTSHAVRSWCVSSAIVFSLMAITGTIRAVRVGGELSTVAAEGA